MLDFVRSELQLDPLIAAAIERGVRARYQRFEAGRIAMRALAAAAAVAGVPVAALVLLAAVGWAPVGPALLGVGATLLAALVLALRWSRDVDLLADSVRRDCGGRARAATVRRCCRACSVSASTSNDWRAAAPHARR